MQVVLCSPTKPRRHRARDWSVSGISADASELLSSKSWFVDRKFMTYLYPRYLLLLILLTGTTSSITASVLLAAGDNSKKPGEATTALVASEIENKRHFARAEIALRRLGRVWWSYNVVKSGEWLWRSFYWEFFSLGRSSAICCPCSWSLWRWHQSKAFDMKVWLAGMKFPTCEEVKGRKGFLSSHSLPFYTLQVACFCYLPFFHVFAWLFVWRHFVI